MIWFGIEPLVAEKPEQAIALALESRIPMLTQFIARRLTVDGKLTRLVKEIGQNADKRMLLLLGMRDGLEGRNDVAPPENWARVNEGLNASGDAASSIALQLSLKFGDAQAVQSLVETLESAESTLEDRRQAIRGLAGRKRPNLSATHCIA